MRTNFKFKHNLSDSEIRSIFEDIMRAHGLVFDSKDLPIILDGKTRYVKVENRSRGKKNSRSGWYSGHLGDFPNGRFGWLHGENPLYTWSLFQHLKDKGDSIEYVELTEEQIIENEKKRAREERRKIEKDRQRAEFSKAYSIIEWERALPLTQHPYLVDKNFSIEECNSSVRILNPKDYTAAEIKEILDRCFPEYNTAANIRKLIDYQVNHVTFRGFNLIMQGRLINGSPMMLQYIFNKKSKSGKNKHFPVDLLKHKTFLSLGKALTADCTEVIICEGWATGISISRFTQNEVPILVTWDSGNMTSVAIELRKTYPNIKIYSANDNDHTQPPKKNAGVKSGIKTCNMVGAYMLTPPFDPNNPRHKSLSDWNDIDNAYPPHESTRIFYECFSNAKYQGAIYNEDVLLLTNNNTSQLFGKNIENQSDIAWHIHFLTISRMIGKGIQNLGYTEQEQVEMYKEGFTQLTTYVQEKKWDQLDRIYDASLDLQLSEIFHDFTLALNNSELHIMQDTALMTALFKQLIGIQVQMPNFNLLNTVRDLIAERYSYETANLCIPYFIDSTRYFVQTKASWLKDLGQALHNKIESPNATNCIPLLLNSKQSKYWEQISYEKRIEAASIDLSEQNETFDPYPPSNEDISEQVSRIKFLQSGVCALLLDENHTSSHTYLKRIIDRFNEVEGTDINILDFAPLDHH